MNNRFQFVEKNNGVYHYYNQSTVFESFHRKTFSMPFEGYCHGISAKYIKNKIQSYQVTSNQLFSSAEDFLKMHLDLEAVRLQLKYEKNPHEFNDAFMRLFYGDFPLNQEKLFLDHINDLLDHIDNKVIFLNIIFHLAQKNTLKLLDHTVVILHDGHNWCFFDPNYGEAKFKNKNDFINWLSMETTEGVLSFFNQPQKTSQGLLSVYKAIADQYSYPQKKLTKQLIERLSPPVKFNSKL